MFNYYLSSILRDLAGSVLASIYDLLPSFNGFDGLTEAHGGHGGGGGRGKSKRGGGGGYSGGGATPKADAKKQALVKRHSALASKDPKNYRKKTSLSSRKIVANFQLQKQTTAKDYSTAVTKSIRRNRAKTTGIRDTSPLKKGTSFRNTRSSRFGY